MINSLFPFTAGPINIGGYIDVGEANHPLAAAAMNENNSTKLPRPNGRNNYIHRNFIHLNRFINPALFISNSLPQGFPL
jgi:hypothetical protein